MKRPTMKDTKEVIMNYAKEIEAELAAEKAGKFDPKEVKETERKKEVAVKAEKLVNRGILSSDITDEYTALQERINDMKGEIEILTGIEVNVNTLAALIEANNIELAEMKEAKDQLITEKTAELVDLQEQINNIESTRKADEAAYQTKLEKDRANEKAEYDYKTKRERDKEKDDWDDKKAIKDKELTDREAALKAREDACIEIEVKNDELQSQIDAVPAQIEKIKATAEADANAKAAKTLGIKETAMKKEVEVDKKLLQQQLETTETALEEVKEALAIKDKELKDAYAQINEIATKSVQAARPVYMQAESNK